MAEAEFFLSTLGFTGREEESLQALLTLSGRGLSSGWHHRRDFKNANAVFVAVDNPEGKALWESLPHNYPAVCFVACSSAAPPADARWRLGMARSALPSRKEFVELLNALSRHLVGEPPAPLASGAEPEPLAPAGQLSAPLAPVPESRAGQAADLDSPEGAAAQPVGGANSSPGSAAFDPGQHFLGVLQSIIASAEDSILVLPGRPWLAVSPRAQSYYSALSHEELQPLLRLPAGAVQVRRLQIEKVLASPWAKDLGVRPLVELLWHASLAASGGRLLAGCRPEDVVRLRQWPPVAHLPSYRKFLRVAAFMSHNAASLQSVAECTGTPIGAVFDFHNACAAMGLVERFAPAEADTARTPPPPAKELYRKISSRLSRASHGG